jgi:hypothetical protein
MPGWVDIVWTIAAWLFVTSVVLSSVVFVSMLAASWVAARRRRAAARAMPGGGLVDLTHRRERRASSVAEPAEDVGGVERSVVGEGSAG